MIKILFIVAGDTSFDEMIFLDAFINQLPSEPVENHILTPVLPLSHVSIQERNVEIHEARPGFGYEEWAEVLEEVKPQVVILCDPYVLLDPFSEDLTYIELEWLDDIEAVVAVMDFRANLLKTPDDQLALEEYILAGETPPYVMDYDFLIKVCPPHDALPSSNPKLLQWGCQDLLASLAVYNVRDQIRNQLGCPPETRIVSLIFPVENTLLSISQGLNRHFAIMIETLIYYFNQLEGHYLLAVVNMPPPFDDFEYENVMVRFFPELDQELLNGLYKATELLLTESLSYPGLITSALQNIPTVVMGSSLALNPDGSLSHAFESLTPFLELKLQSIIEEDPEILFPYLAFPRRFKYAWPQTRVFDHRFFYYLVDIFNEADCVATFEQLLNGGEAQEQFFGALREYRELKLGLTIDADKVIKKLITAPPRNV